MVQSHGDPGGNGGGNGGGYGGGLEVVEAVVQTPSPASTRLNSPLPDSVVRPSRQLAVRR